ncbi:MAG: hypothetical protein IJ794_13375 [Lachnospiraceae bacterium]|nr:hypothetical protein [Lachnospiraceae bacterium]
METIKNYLETMFKNLPDTPEVQKAKEELLSMMEDKYTELLNEGHTQNEAIGTVISEFGNLDELAEDLGIVSLVRPISISAQENTTPENTAPENIYEQPKTFPMDDVTGYLQVQKHRALLTALGVFLCVSCPIPVILLELYDNSSMETIGVISLLIMIAVAVGLFITANIQAGKYDYLKKDNYALDAAATAEVTAHRDQFRTRYAILLSVGVVCCILSATPAIVLDSLKDTLNLNSDLIDALSGAGVLLIVAIGVFMIVASNILMDGYNSLLKLNGTGSRTSDGASAQKNSVVHYTNPTVAAIMSVYWPTVTCLYLMWSFLTFDWHITWIIWPVTGIFKKMMDNIWADRNN